MREVLIMKPNIDNVTKGHGVRPKNKEIQSAQFKVLYVFCTQNSDIIPNS